MIIASEVSQRKTDTMRYHLYVGSKKKNKIQMNNSQNRKELRVTDNTLKATKREVEEG